MIASDTSSLIAFFGGDKGADVEAVDKTLEQKLLVLPPPVLTELLSDPHLPQGISSLLKEIPLLEIIPGYWERAGLLRSKIISKRRKARLADTLISQFCIDHNVSLITRDTDFKHYARFGGLKLII